MNFRNQEEKPRNQPIINESSKSLKRTIKLADLNQEFRNENAQDRFLRVQKHTAAVTPEAKIDDLDFQYSLKYAGAQTSADHRRNKFQALPTGVASPKPLDIDLSPSDIKLDSMHPIGIGYCQSSQDVVKEKFIVIDENENQALESLKYSMSDSLLEQQYEEDYARHQLGSELYLQKMLSNSNGTGVYQQYEEDYGSKSIPDVELVYDITPEPETIENYQQVNQNNLLTVT